MLPGQYDFRVRRGDTETLGVILEQQDVRTGEMARLPMSGHTARWNLALPDGAIEATSATDGGLVYEPTYGALLWPMTPSQTSRFPSGQPVPFQLKIVAETGGTATWLVGTVTGEG